MRKKYAKKRIVDYSRINLMQSIWLKVQAFKPSQKVTLYLTFFNVLTKYWVMLILLPKYK